MTTKTLDLFGYAEVVASAANVICGIDKGVVPACFRPSKELMENLEHYIVGMEQMQKSGIIPSDPMRIRMLRETQAVLTAWPLSTEPVSKELMLMLSAELHALLFALDGGPCLMVVLL